MQNVLEQLIGETVIIGTVADPPSVAPLLLFVRIDEVKDFLVTVTDETTNTTFVVTIADIVGVGFLPGPDIELEDPVDFPGQCDCRERPLRELFDTLIGETVDVIVSQGSVGASFTVERTGLGIVFGELPIDEVGTMVKQVISLCQITTVRLGSNQ